MPDSKTVEIDGIDPRMPEAGRVTPPRDPTPGGGEMTDEEITDEEIDALDALARMVADGRVTITNVRIRVCGKCKEGTMKGASTPNYMNRVKCDKCGHCCSR